MTSAGTSRAAVDQLVDWDLAARTAATLTRSGPVVRPAEAAQAVSELRAAAAEAGAHVQRVSRLTAAPDAEVLVVDRAGWSRANANAFRTVLEPVVEEAFARRGGGAPAPLVAVGSRVAGAEVGSLLGFLSSRVLGQYDPFSPGPGRLLLVVPNVVQAEQDLAVEPSHFRLWVCLHEETHRVQFSANPWLAPHLLAEVRSLVGDLMVDPAQLADRLSAAVRSVPDLLRGGEPRNGDGADRGTGIPLLDAVQTPEQRARLADLTAVMSLLEGHADVVMDEVGPQVVPTVEVIRERFTRRRAGQGAVDRLLRRLLGLDAKMRQYAEGARFVRAVTAQVGVEGFNRVWTSPDTLPRAAEIADPDAWVRRVAG